MERMNFKVFPHVVFCSLSQIKYGHYYWDRLANKLYCVLSCAQQGAFQCNIDGVCCNGFIMST